jgi:hypothetical protein
LARAFEDLILVHPKSLRYDGQLYAAVVEDLSGAALPLQETTVTVPDPMRTGSLYVMDRDKRDALELLPFVRMKTGTPAATACYFYSRVVGPEVRFVSYHQALESELKERDDTLLALVADLKSAARSKPSSTAAD